jgi:hypothetical protein
MAVTVTRPDIGNGSIVVSHISVAMGYEVVDGHLHLIKPQQGVFMSFAPGSWVTVEIIEIPDNRRISDAKGGNVKCP